MLQSIRSWEWDIFLSASFTCVSSERFNSMILGLRLRFILWLLCSYTGRSVLSLFASQTFGEMHDKMVILIPCLFVFGPAFLGNKWWWWWWSWWWWWWWSWWWFHKFCGYPYVFQDGWMVKKNPSHVMNFWHHSTYQVQRTIRTHFQGVRCDNFGRSCLLGQAEKTTFQVSAHICWGMNLFQIRTGGRDQAKQLVLIIPGGWPNFRQLSSKILRLVWYWVGWFLLMFTIGFLMGGVQGHPQSYVLIVSLRSPKFPSYPSCTFFWCPQQSHTIKQKIVCLQNWMYIFSSMARGLCTAPSPSPASRGFGAATLRQVFKTIHSIHASIQGERWKIQPETKQSNVGNFSLSVVTWESPNPRASIFCFREYQPKPSLSIASWEVGASSNLGVDWICFTWLSECCSPTFKGNDSLPRVPI